MTTRRGFMAAILASGVAPLYVPNLKIWTPAKVLVLKPKFAKAFHEEVEDYYAQARKRYVANMKASMTETERQFMSVLTEAYPDDTFRPGRLAATATFKDPILVRHADNLVIRAALKSMI